MQTSPKGGQSRVYSEYEHLGFEQQTLIEVNRKASIKTVIASMNLPWSSSTSTLELLRKVVEYARKSS